MMVIGSSPEDKAMANITLMIRIDTKAIGKMIRKTEREFNIREATGMKANSKTALNIVTLPLWSL